MSDTGRRGWDALPELWGIGATGDVWYQDADGFMVALPIPADWEAQALVGSPYGLAVVDGLPAWVAGGGTPVVLTGPTLTADDGTVLTDDDGNILYADFPGFADAFDRLDDLEDTAGTFLIETGGPTVLPIGAIADGEYLRRVGDEIVGDTPGGGSGIADGDYGDVVVTGSGTVLSLDSGVVTAAARTVLDDTTTAAMRTTLGLGIGTDVQAYHANLAALAGLTGASDRLAYFTGVGTLTLATFTAFGRTLAALADAAAGRVALGVIQQALIFDSTLGAPASTIDTGAAGVPGGYNMLEIVVIGRTDEVVAASPCPLIFNNDTAGNYTRELIGANNATAIAAAGTADAGILVVFPGASNTTSTFGIWRFVVPAYTQTTAYKVVDSSGGFSDTTATRSQVYTLGGTWRNTAAITRVAINAPAAKNFIAGSRMLIYGR